jgi:hypothetical protein
MTVDEVLARVARIEAMKGDDEIAHGEEDTLPQDVLSAIAERRCVGAPADLAAAALKTLEIKFARWCA